MRGRDGGLGAGGSLVSLRAAWPTKGVPGQPGLLHKEACLGKIKPQKTKLIRTLEIT